MSKRSDLIAYAGLGCLGFCLGPVLGAFWMASSMLGWPTAACLILLFGIVFLLFLYSHPAYLYISRSKALKNSASVTLEEFRRKVRAVIIGTLVLLGIIFFGFVYPEIIHKCVPFEEYVPFRAGEMMVLYFILAICVKRALTSLSEKYAPDAKFLFLPARLVHGLFLIAFILTAFSYLFIHAYLANSFYFTTSWGLPAFLALSFGFAGIVLLLDKYIAIPKRYLVAAQPPIGEDIVTPEE